VVHLLTARPSWSSRAGGSQCWSGVSVLVWSGVAGRSASSLGILAVDRGRERSGGGHRAGCESFGVRVWWWAHCVDRLLVAAPIDPVDEPSRRLVPQEARGVPHAADCRRVLPREDARAHDRATMRQGRPWLPAALRPNLGADDVVAGEDEAKDVAGRLRSRQRASARRIATEEEAPRGGNGGWVGGEREGMREDKRGGRGKGAPAAKRAPRHSRGRA
jgi:hypothetical protein